MEPRVLNKELYDTVFFEASSQSSLLLQIALYAADDDGFVEAINLNPFSEGCGDDCPYTATVTISH